MSEWISVGDALPDDCTLVWCWCWKVFNGQTGSELFFCEGKFYEPFDKEKEIEVTHWMALPPSPKEPPEENDE